MASSVRLICEKCSSDALEQHGAKSVLDGKCGWRCTRCGNSMGPARSKLFLGFLMLLSIAVTLAGLLFIVLFVTDWVHTHIFPITPGRVLVFSGSVIGPITFFTVFRAFQEKRPRREYTRLVQDEDQ